MTSLATTAAAAAVLGLAAGAGGAAAQGPPAVGCEVADFSMMFRLYMPIDATGSPAQPMQGTLEILHQKVPRDRRTHVLDGKRPAQFWNQGNELKLLLALGAGDDPVTLVIDTVQRQPGDQHTGNFRLNVSGLRLSGRISCTVG